MAADTDRRVVVCTNRLRRVQCSRINLNPISIRIGAHNCREAQLKPRCVDGYGAKPRERFLGLGDPRQRFVRKSNIVEPQDRQVEVGGARGEASRSLALERFAGHRAVRLPDEDWGWRGLQTV